MDLTLLSVGKCNKIRRQANVVLYVSSFQFECFQNTEASLKIPKSSTSINFRKFPAF